MLLSRQDPDVPCFKVGSYCNGFYVENCRTGEEAALGDGTDTTLLVMGKRFTLDDSDLDSRGEEFAELWTWSFNRDPEAQEACFG